MFVDQVNITFIYKKINFYIRLSSNRICPKHTPHKFIHENVYVKDMLMPVYSPGRIWIILGLYM